MKVCTRCNKKFLFKSPDPALCRRCYDTEARERAGAEARQRTEVEARERAEAEKTLAEITATYKKIQSMRGYNTSPATMKKYLAICESFLKRFKEFAESAYAPVVIQAGKARFLHGYAYVKDFGYLPYEDFGNGEARVIFDSILDVAEKKATLLRRLLEGEPKAGAEKGAKPSDINTMDYSWSFPEDYVVLDVETTGLNHKRERIIEIAAVKFLGGVERDSFVTFVNPGRPISYEITALTGIKNSNLRNAPFIEEVIPELSFFLGDLPLVAHNASFDRAFLSDAYWEVGLGLKNKSIDTLSLARKAFPQLKNHKLSFLKSHLHLAPRRSHRALADVYTTAELFLVCKNILCSEQEEQKD